MHPQRDSEPKATGDAGGTTREIDPPAPLPVDVRVVQRSIKERYLADPSLSRVTLRATATAHPTTPSPFLCGLETRGNRFESAAHEAIGIQHPAACSGEFLLAALAACAQTSVQVIANALRIPLRHAEVYVEGDLDFRGTLGMSRETAIGFTAVRVRYEIEAPEASAAQLKSLHEKVERYCIIQQTLIKPPSLESEWLHSASIPTLFQFVFSCSCEKVRRALHQKGVKWRTVEVFWFDRSDLLRLTGQTLAPVFVHDGTVLGPESMQIVEYIEKAFDGPTLFPHDSAAYCREVNDYVENIMFPIAKRAFLPAAAKAMKPETFEDDVRRMTGASPDELRAVLGETAAAYREHLEKFEARLVGRDYLTGALASAADHILFSNLWFATNNPEFRRLVDAMPLPNIRNWEHRMRAQFETRLPF